MDLASEWLGGRQANILSVIPVTIARDIHDAQMYARVLEEHGATEFIVF